MHHPATAKEFLQHFVAKGTDLGGAIEQLLSFLEHCKGHSVRLPADCVDLAATLIRMYSETKTTGVPTWITRERARRLAAQLADKRIPGLDFRPSKRACSTSSSCSAKALREPSHARVSSTNRCNQ